jgi:integrase
LEDITMKAWLFQDHRQKEKLGEKKAPWSVGWYDDQGCKKSKRMGTKTAAQNYARRIEGEIAAGTYQRHKNVPWKKFRDEFEAKVMKAMKASTRLQTKITLDHFEKIVKPQRVSAIGATTIADFIVKRREARGVKPGSTVSPATVNKDLRTLRAVLNVAVDWEYLAKPPKFRFLREPEKLVQYVTAEDFAKIYQACDAATRPDRFNFTAGEWWRALLMFAYMTGWRISEILALRREDLEWNTGHAITRHGDNKGGREERIKLHPIVLEHLKAIASFEPVVFPWPSSRRTLYTEFHAIQTAAGIHLPCRENHTHTPACRLYGFHVERRAFATTNAGRLSGDVLQKLMRHRHYSTTQRYINMASRVDEAVEVLAVPALLSGAG